MNFYNLFKIKGKLNNIFFFFCKITLSFYFFFFFIKKHQGLKGIFAS